LFQKKPSSIEVLECLEKVTDMIIIGLITFSTSYAIISGLLTARIFAEPSQFWRPFYASANFRRNSWFLSTFDISPATNGSKQHR